MLILLLAFVLGSVPAAAAERVTLPEEAVPLAASGTQTAGIPAALGTQTQKNAKAVIDYSNASSGYVMVQYTAAAAGKTIKAQVAGPTITYTYTVPAGVWVTFPFTEGNASYKVTVFESVGTKFASVVTATIKVTLTSEQSPFMYSNQYVDYQNAPNTIAKAAELAGAEADPLKKVEKIYNFVIGNLTYDDQRAATVKSGYVPVLDSVLAEKKGICFDYAALMSGMLRSQGVPCKMVFGYAGDAYHAWISVWTEATGWIGNAIYFDGNTWHRMDPTFASSSNSSAAILKYIGDGANYKPQKNY